MTKIVFKWQILLNKTVHMIIKGMSLIDSWMQFCWFWITDLFVGAQLKTQQKLCNGKLVFYNVDRSVSLISGVKKMSYGKLNGFCPTTKLE